MAEKRVAGLGEGTGDSKKAPEVLEESEAVYRPRTTSYTLRRAAGEDVGEVGHVHTKAGTVIFTITPTETVYEAVINGRLHTRREMASRPSRGARIIAAQWLGELIGEGESSPEE